MIISGYIESDKILFYVFPCSLMWLPGKLKLHVTCIYFTRTALFQNRTKLTLFAGEPRKCGSAEPGFSSPQFLINGAA